jgi:hypothetical protein
MSKSIWNLASIVVSPASIGHFQVPMGQTGFGPPDRQQSMVAIAAGYVAIDKKSWTRELQSFTLER